jgi:hypothetical protein
MLNRLKLRLKERVAVLAGKENNITLAFNRRNNSEENINIFD